jgi:glycosyltransferase involved in cell wall biosynthesis
MTEPIMATVLVVTYNHGGLIRQSLDSVYAQECSFPYEVIISEDCSTDNTRQIVQEYADRYPQQTRLIFSPENLRTNEVVRRGFDAAKGKYVALLDGDDYWTSNNRLSRLVKCLEADASLSLCFHNAKVSSGSTGFGELWSDPSMPERQTLDCLWEGNPFATCGSLFRRSAIPRIPDWYCDFFPITDWPLYILFAEHGEIAFIPEPMGVYRIHSGGLFSSNDELTKLHSTSRLFQRLNEATEFRHDHKLRRGHHRYFLGWARKYLAEGDVRKARKCLHYASSYPARYDARAMAERTFLRALIALERL